MTEVERILSDAWKTQLQETGTASVYPGLAEYDIAVLVDAVRYSAAELGIDAQHLDIVMRTDDLWDVRVGR